MLLPETCLTGPDSALTRRLMPAGAAQWPRAGLGAAQPPLLGHWQHQRQHGGGARKQVRLGAGCGAVGAGPKGRTRTGACQHPLGSLTEHTRAGHLAWRRAH